MSRRLAILVAVLALVAGGPLLMPAPSETHVRPGPELAYPASQFTTLAGIEVHHQVRGPADGPTVLLSHHFYGSVPTWRHVMGGLDDAFRVTAFDRPGFGLTERPTRAAWGDTNPYTRQTAARIGWELLDELGAEQAVLVGSSAGGTNVLEMYARHPERVRALVLLSPAITGDVGPPNWLRPVLRGPQGRALAPPIVRRIAQDITPERVASSWADPTRVTAADAEPYQRMTQVAGWELGFWELVNAEPRPDLREVVEAIDVPTLVITGDQDRVINPRWNRRTAQAIDGARFEVLDNCGHTPHEECPQQLLQVMRDFLDELPAA